MGGRLWYGGKELPSGQPEEFDEDCVMCHETTACGLTQLESSGTLGVERGIAWSVADDSSLCQA